MTWLGRQLADHFGLEPEMLRVRIPPELLATTRPRGAARSARHPVNEATILPKNPFFSAFKHTVASIRGVASHRTYCIALIAGF